MGVEGKGGSLRPAVLLANHAPPAVLGISANRPMRHRELLQKSLRATGLGLPPPETGRIGKMDGSLVPMIQLALRVVLRELKGWLRRLPLRKCNKRGCLFDWETCLPVRKFPRVINSPKSYS